MIAKRHAFDGHWLTVSQIATESGCGERYVRRAIKSGVGTFAELSRRHAAGRARITCGLGATKARIANRKAAWNPHKAARIKPGDVFDDGRVYGQ